MSCSFINLAISATSPNESFSQLKEKLLEIEKENRSSALRHWIDSKKSQITEAIENDTNGVWGKRPNQTAIQRFNEIKLLLLTEFNDNGFLSDIQSENEVLTSDEKEKQKERNKEFFDRKISKVEEDVFGKNRILINSYRANFRSLVILSLLFYKETEGTNGRTRISYSLNDINKSLFELKRQQYKVLLNYYNRLSGVQKLKNAYRSRTEFNITQKEALLESFEDYLQDNLNGIDVTLLERWRESNGDLHAGDEATLLDAVQAYMFIKYFDDLLLSEFPVIKVERNMDGVDTLLFDDDGEIIQKYVFNKSKSIKESYGNEFYDALAQVGNFSKTIAESIESKSIVDKTSLKERIKISDFGISFNSLKNAIYRMPYSVILNRQKLKQLKECFENYKDNPNEYVILILNIIHSLTGDVQTRHELEKHGCEIHNLNVLYSISDFLNRVTLIENRDIAGEADGSSLRQGIHSLLRLDILINLLTQIAPANYLSTDQSYGNNKTSYISKNQSELNRRYNKISGLKLAMYRMSAPERRILLNNRVEFVDYIYNENKRTHSTSQLVLHLKNRQGEIVNFRLVSYNSRGSVTSLFEDVNDITLHKDIDSDTEAEYKNLLENIGIENVYDVFDKGNRDVVKKYLNDLDVNDPRNAEMINKINNYLSDTEDVFDSLRRNSFSNRLLSLINSEENNDYDAYRSLLQFIGDMLDLPLNTTQGREILFKAMNNSNGITLRHFMIAASRIAMLHMSMSEYFEANDNETKKYDDFRLYVRENFGTTIQDKFMLSYGREMMIPNPIQTTEGWTKAWYEAEALVLGISFPSTTKNAEKNNIANFRETSLASSYREIFTEHAKDQTSAAHNNLFVTFRNAIVDFAYDMQVVTRTGTKKLIKELNQSELIYHQVVHNFFNSYATNGGVFQIQPTVYSDKTAFVLYTVNPENIQLPEGTKNIRLVDLNVEQYMKLYASTVGDYYKRSFQGTINRFLALYYYFEGNSADKSVAEINSWLNTKTKSDMLRMILEYNQHLDDLKYDIQYGLAKLNDGTSVNPNNAEQVKTCLLQNGFKSSERMLLAIDADFRAYKNKNGQEYLSLVEIAKYYNDMSLMDHGLYNEDLEQHMQESMRLMIYDFYKYRIKINTKHLSDIFKPFMGNETVQAWSEEKTGDLVFAKTKDGKIIRNLTEFNNTQDIIINPALVKYFWIENILSANLKYGLLGDEVADPDKVSGVSLFKQFSPSSKYYQELSSGDNGKSLFSTDQIQRFQAMDTMQLGLEIENGNYNPKQLNVLRKIYRDNCNRIISSCEGAQYKRNVIMPATMVPMNVNALNGLGKVTNMAINDDIKAPCFNTKGEVDWIDSQDGGGFRTALQADLENASLGDNATGYDLAKTIWHQYDKKTGKAFLAKWAVYTLSNVRMRDSSGSSLLNYKLYKRMTNMRWKGAFDIVNSRLINATPSKKIDFDADILSQCSGGLYYQLNDTTYNIDDLNILNYNNNPAHRYYYTQENHKDGNLIKTEKVVTLFDENSDEIKLRISDAINEDGIKIGYILNNEVFATLLDVYNKVDEIALNNNLHTIDSNFELFVALGGINCVNSYTDDGVSENSHHAVTAFMNNVFTVEVEGKQGMNQGHYILPLKQMQIGYVTNKSTIKRYQANLNDKSAWNGDSDLSYILVDNRFLGKQGDPDHEADESEVSEMTQVIASLDVGGETHIFAKQSFEALGRLTANGMRANVEALAKILNINNNNKDLVASLIYHIIGEAFFKGYKSNNQFDIGNDIITGIKKKFYAQGYNGHRLESDIEQFLPVSDPNVFGALINSITSQMNDLALKRKYSGIGSVLVPGFDVVLLYHFWNSESGLTFDDIYKLSSLPKYIKTNGGKFYTYSKNQVIKELGFLISTDDTTGKLKIDGSFSRKKGSPIDLNTNQKTILLLNMLKENLILGDEVLVSGINPDILESVGLIRIGDNAYKYKPLTEYQRRKVLAESYLKVEQNKAVYTKSADQFVPTDRVDIYSGNKVYQTITLDELHKYYEFKHIFVTLNQLIKDEVARNPAGLFALLLNKTGSDREMFIQENYVSLLNTLYPKIGKNILSINPEAKTWDDISYELKNSEPFYLMFYTSLHEGLQFRENIKKPYNLRPLQIKFQTQNGTFANIYDIDASVDLYLKNTKYVKFRDVRSDKSDSDLRREITEATRILSGEGEGNISVYGTNQSIDQYSVEIKAAEAIMSNIYLSMFNLGNRSMYEQDTDFKSSKTNKIDLLKSDFSLCSTKSRISFILGDVDMNSVYGNKFKKYYVQEDYVQDGNDNVDIYAIDRKTKQALYKIGYLERADALIKYDPNSDKFTKGSDTLLNQEDYIERNGIVYKKNYFVNFYSRSVNNRKEQFVKFNYNELNKAGLDNDYIQSTIREIKVNGKYQWLLLNGSMAKTNDGLTTQSKTSHLEKVLSILDGLKFDYQQEKAFDLSVDRSYLFLRKLINDILINPEEKNNDDTYVNLYNYYTDSASYENVLKNMQKDRTKYMRASYDLSKMIISARIPAQSLQSYMSMQVVGYLPTSSNLVIVSHFQTWLLGSDYDIDKSYIMAFLFSNNGVFESWSPLFDFSSSKTLKESLKLSMPAGIRIFRAIEGGINIDSELQEYNRLNKEVEFFDSDPGTFRRINNSTRVINNIVETVEQDGTSKDGPKSLKISYSDIQTNDVLAEIQLGDDTNGTAKAMYYKVALSDNLTDEQKIDVYKTIAKALPLDNTLTRTYFELSDNLSPLVISAINPFVKISKKKIGTQVITVALTMKAQYLDKVKLQRMKVICKLVDTIENNSSDKQCAIQNSETVEQSLDILNKILQHEDYELSLSNMEAATKNFIASRIYNISSDPRNMWCAYTPIQVSTLHKAADNANKNVEPEILMGSNPLAKSIMQYLNMDGKNVIGITAVGERVFMALSYYWNEMVASGDEKKMQYMHFIHHTRRVKNRAKGTPVECFRNVKTDINWKLALDPLKIKDALIAWKGFKDKVTRELRLEYPSISEAELQGKVDKIVEENSDLWTQGDELISILLSAATDNAKELILSRINAGKQNADMYIHLIILGYNIDDIVAFMISPSVLIITDMTAGNIFNNDDTKLRDIIKLINGDGFKIRTFQFINEECKNQNVSEDLKKQNFKSVKDLTKYILSTNDNVALAQLNEILHADSLGTPTYTLQKIDLLFELHLTLMDNNVTYDDFIADANEYHMLNNQKGETKNLGTLCGLAKGVDPVLNNQISKINSVENIFNKAVRYFSFHHANNELFGLFVVSNETTSDDAKEKEKACIAEIIDRHRNWDEVTVKRYLNDAVKIGLLKWNKEEGMYQCKFNLNDFVENRTFNIDGRLISYCDVTLHIYDFVKQQYNIFDVIANSPLYMLAMRGWSIVDRVRTMSSIKGEVLNLVKQSLQQQNAPFEDFEIGRAVDYANELLISKWLQNRIDKNKAIKFIVPKGGLIYTDEMDIIKAENDTEITLGDNKSIRTFKLWVENYLIPILKQNTDSGVVYIGDKPVHTKPNNLFLQKLLYAKDGGLVFRKLDFDMGGKVEGFHNSLEIQSLIDSFNELDLQNENLPIKITDYFMLYNLLVNKNKPGRDRMTNLMHKLINNKGSLLTDYNDFVGREDQKLKQVKASDIETYLLLNFNYSFDDVKLKIARTYRSNAKLHNGELVIFETDSEGKMTIKEREKDYGKKSSYRESHKSRLWQFLAKDNKKIFLRLRNLAEDGIFMNVSSELSKKYQNMLYSKDPAEVLLVLTKELRDRRMLIDYNCA